MKMEWTVRVINPKQSNGPRPSVHLRRLWVEQLRRLGVLRVLLQNDEHEVLEFGFPGNPRGIDTKFWAEQEAKSMKSFGINAVAAPKWNHGQSV